MRLGPSGPPATGSYKLSGAQVTFVTGPYGQLHYHGKRTPRTLLPVERLERTSRCSTPTAGPQESPATHTDPGVGSQLTGAVLP